MRRLTLVTVLGALASSNLTCGSGGAAALEDAGADASTPDAGAAPSDAGLDAAVADAGADSGRPDSGLDAAVCRREVPPPLDAGAPADGGPVDPGPALDCGAPSFEATSGMRRRPYLQSVTGTSARVVWTSTSGLPSAVEHATSPDGPWTRVAASEELFETTRTLDGEDYVQYVAQLSGLSPDARYCYRVLEDGQVIASGLALDTAWSGTARPLRLIAFGDSGTSSAGQLALRDVILTHPFDVFLHLGDVAYPDGTFTELEQHFFGVYRDVLHRRPVFPAIGNHEYETNHGQPYLDVFSLPEMALRPSDRERYYSFDWGNVHFVVLDSNEELLVPILLDLAGTMRDDMIDWLAADLAASDADWKIAVFHHPPYTSSDRGLNTLVISEILPVLERGGVDLVLNGHDHHYERMTAIRGGCAVRHDEGGMDFIIAGGGGAGLRDVTPQWFSISTENRLHTFVALEIHGCTARGEAVASDGTVVDTFVLDGC